MLIGEVGERRRFPSQLTSPLTLIMSLRSAELGLPNRLIHPTFSLISNRIETRDSQPTSDRVRRARPNLDIRHRSLIPKSQLLAVIRSPDRYMYRQGYAFSSNLASK